MKVLRNNFSFEKSADTGLSENYDNNFFISMNSSSCKLSFHTLVGFLRCTYAFLSSPRNFTKIFICVGKVFVIAHLIAINTLIPKILRAILGDHVVEL